MSVETDAVDLVGDETVENVARAVLFAAITAVTAPMSLTHPLAPEVPITLQTFWVYLSGIVLGPVWAGVAFVLYLFAGALGLPVFEQGGGLGYFVGPTGGYLAGFVVAAVLVGLLVHGVGDLRDPLEVSLPRILVALIAGTLVIWGLGALWLVLGGYMGTGAALALTSKFLFTGAIKVAGAVAVTRSDALVAR